MGLMIQPCRQPLQGERKRWRIANNRPHPGIKFDTLGQLISRILQGPRIEFKAPEYFYALAQISIAFVGFGANRHRAPPKHGKPLSKFHLFLTRIFIESGLMAATFSMLAPTLAIGGIEDTTLWKSASIIMLVVLVPWVIAYPIRRKANSRGAKLPPRVYVMFALGLAAILGLALNAFWFEPTALPVVMAVIYVLVFASVAFLFTYSIFIQG